MPSPIVTLYARPDCHLCDQAREQLRSLRDAGLAFELDEVDIDADERLRSRYLERIPVVMLDGELVSELGLDEDGFRARLDTLSR
jgi:glutaredoxin